MLKGRWCKLLWLGLMLPLACRADGQIATGEVESVQLLDASQLGGGERLVMVLLEGRGFRLPGAHNVALSPGMRVEVQHVAQDADGELAVACVVRVLAVPLERDGEWTMQEAERPFVVYRNETTESAC